MPRVKQLAAESIRGSLNKLPVANRLGQVSQKPRLAALPHKVAKTETSQREVKKSI